MAEMKTLTCEVCGSSFQHPKQRGRPPKACPEHRGQKPPKKQLKGTDPFTVEELDELTALEPIEVTEVIPPRRGRISQPMLCGWCGGAPRSSDGPASHLRCPGGYCTCAMVKHKPTAEIRKQQAGYNFMTVEECIKYDPGLVEVSSE